MFDITSIDFSNGVYAPDNKRVNGAEALILQSSENADKVISDFEKAIEAGLNPNSIIDQVLKKHHLTENDFIDSDIDRINRTVEKIYKAKHGGLKF